MSGLPLAWTAEGRDDYLYWQTQDRKTLRRINLLIADILRDDPFEGIGKPEPLKHALAGAWSRRIDEADAWSTSPMRRTRSCFKRGTTTDSDTTPGRGSLSC